MTNQTKEMEIIPIAPGEAHLQNIVINETHCYICKKEFNKFDDKEMLLLRTKGHEMNFCCPHHKGVAQEFVRQYRAMPGGWEKHVKKDDSVTVDTSNDSADNNTSTKQKNKTKKRRN